MIYRKLKFTLQIISRPSVKRVRILKTRRVKKIWRKAKLCCSMKYRWYSKRYDAETNLLLKTSVFRDVV